MSANDIREMEDLNPIPEEEGGNLYLVNGNMIRLTDTAVAAPTGDTGNTGSDNNPNKNTQGGSYEKKILELGEERR